jgi:hypothetical protein
LTWINVRSDRRWQTDAEADRHLGAPITEPQERNMTRLMIAALAAGTLAFAAPGFAQTAAPTHDMGPGGNGAAMQKDYMGPGGNGAAQQKDDMGPGGNGAAQQKNDSGPGGNGAAKASDTKKQ